MIKTLLLLTALALVQAYPEAEPISSRRYEPHPDCPPAEIHFLLPHEYDCTKFYYCEYGLKWIEPRDCAPGTEFNAEIQVCVHPASSGCHLPGYSTEAGPVTAPPTTAAPPPVTAAPTTAAPVTAAPTTAAPVTAAPTTAAPVTAAPTTAAPVTAAPTTAAPVTAAPTTSAPATVGPSTVAPPTSGPAVPTTLAPEDCEPLENGCPSDFTVHKLLPHEEYCHKFYYCDKGELVLRYCPQGTYFNPEIEVCDWPFNVDCVNDGSYEYPSTAAPAPTTPGGGNDIGPVLPNGCPADFEVHHLLPHETQCDKFYYCVFGEKVERSCAPGTHFNFEIQVCDWPANVGCVSGPTNPTTVGVPDSSEEIPSPDDPVGPQDPEEWVPLPNGCPSNFDVHHLLPHESDCGKFYYCVHGQTVVTDCPAGLHFSPSTQTCDWPVNAGCEHWVNPGPCNPNPDGSCTSTAAPVSTTTRATPGPISSTPSAPDSSEEIPIPDDPIDPVDPEEPCEPLPNGCPSNFSVHHLLPHESDCGKFYYCVNGETVESDCPAGLHFSPWTQTCDWPVNAGCEHWVNPGPCNPNPDGSCTSTAAPVSTTTRATPGPISSTPSAPDSSEEIPIPDDPVDPEEPCEPLPNGCPSDFDVHQLLPHESDCGKFYYCVNGETVETDCPAGLHFSPWTQTCDWPVNAGCTTTSGPGISSTPSVPDSSEEIPIPDDPVGPQDPEEPWVPLPNGCPSNFSVHHLLPHESDCGKFYYCVYGDIVETDCPPGLHFSPLTQTCDWPQYAGCEHWVDPNPCPNPNPGGGCTSTAEPSTTTQGTTTQGTEGTTRGTEGTTQGTEGTTRGTEGTTRGTEGTTRGTTTPEDPDCDTQPAFTTTAAPDTSPGPVTVDTTSPAPVTPTIPTTLDPVIPVDKCQNECNIAPWAHDDCDKFWICSGNQAIVINCSEGLQFNPQTYTCDFNCNVGCVRNTIQATAGYDGVKVFLPWNQVDANMMKALKIEL